MNSSRGIGGLAQGAVDTASYGILYLGIAVGFVIPFFMTYKLFTKNQYNWNLKDWQVNVFSTAIGLVFALIVALNLPGLLWGTSPSKGELPPPARMQF